MRWLVQASAMSLWLCLLSVALHSSAANANDERSLTVGWSPFPPFAYAETLKGVRHWRGLDVELLAAIAERTEYSVSFSEVDWEEHIRKIGRGTLDIATAATRTPERERFAYFSLPYRSETIVLILRRDEGALSAETVVELLDFIKERHFRVGVDPGAAYPGEALQAFIDNPDNSKLVVGVRPEAFLDALLHGEIDGYFTDRIVAADIIEANKAEREVKEHPVTISGDLHVMFSKASVPAKVVADFDRAIKEIRRDGTYRRLNELYTFPILVRLTLKNNWFMVADIIGTVAFALSGLLLAFRYNYDVFGALVLAALPAVGGGVVRDLITNRETLAVLSSPIYVEIVAGLVLGGYLAIRVAMAMRRSRLGAAASALFARRRDQVNVVVRVFDAVGLAAFTVTGVVVALATQAAPLWLWGPILASITAAGGGILRDVVRSDPGNPLLKGELYPEIALLWGGILSVYLIDQMRQLNADEIALGFIVTFVGAFLTRIATMYFGIRSPRFSL